MADEQAKGGKRSQRNTFRGYGPPKQEPPEDLDPEEASFEKAAPLRAPAAKPHHRRGQPAVDIDLIHERRTAPLPDHEWTFVEIWTRNTIYALDSRLVCIAVVDQNTRRSHPDHALIGARLVGGQRRDGEAMELSHPFPRPGSEAVFEQSKGRQVRFSQTSTVTRVVLRLRVLTVASDNLLPTWEEITGRHDVPPALRDENESKG
ncbi:MAG TPA: hypothetical protein RMH99_27465 [Sandaracinaceae bacterium LLY-WYZ-13_1]|nr:hypothetical protein [Sandaracinaceae bacterium LLY-WYZ-13_1]